MVVIRDQFATLDDQQQALSVAAPRTRRRAAPRWRCGSAWPGWPPPYSLLAASAIALHRMVVRPVKRLADAVGRLRAGDLSARVPERGVG